jgi:TnpA family transposase
VARRQRLSDIQIAELFDPPTDQRELVRHFTLSAADLASVQRCRGDHNRLGHALMLCYLRFPGRALRTGERPPPALLAFVAEQVEVLPDAINDYLAAERSRQRQSVECQEQLGLRPFGTRAAAELVDGLLAQAIENDRLADLAALVMETCRQRRIVTPSPVALERFCAELRYRARREAHRRLTDGLSADQRKRLDTLTQRREDTGQSWLTWLQQMPQAAKPAAMLGLIERLEHVRGIGITPGRGHLVHQARLVQLAREAGRTTVQHVAGYERQRRHAILVAISLGTSASLTDAAIDLFDRLIGAMFRKAEGRQARAFQADARAINDKVRLYARVGAALIAARAGKQDAFDAIIAVVSWERFCTMVAEAEALARPEEFNAYQNVGEHYAGIRRWSPAFLDAFEFESVPACASLMRAIAVLREANHAGRSTLPKSAPIGFVRQRWAALVMPEGAIDWRHYELCALSELRDRLQAGDVWVTGSRQYRSFEERLISVQTLQEMQQAGTLPIAVEADFEAFIASRSTRLDERLAVVDVPAREGALPDVTINGGVLKIAPIEKSTPPEAEALAVRLYAMLPRVRITDLLAEVARWTLFPDCFTHLRTGEARGRHSHPDGGATRRRAQPRPDPHGGSLQCREPQPARLDVRLAHPQGNLRFGAAAPGEPAAAGAVRRTLWRRHRLVVRWPVLSGRQLRPRREPPQHPLRPQAGFKAYTHLSDRFGPFFTKLIAATASEVLHVLDALLYHQSEVSTRRHHTDGGGESDHVFALCTLLGFQFAPRILDLKHRRLYSFAKPSAYPALEPMIAGRINVALIRAHWSEILRIIASIRTGTVTASLIMRQLVAYPRQNGVAAALRELGRLERTLFTLDWIDNPELRRATGQELNKGETRNSLARAVFLHRLGQIRDRTYENQQHRASGLNLLVTAIILWNTRYLERAVAALRQAEEVPDHLLAHLSPLGWEHVNLTGDYIWAAHHTMSENIDGMRALRLPPDTFAKAA